MARRTYTSTITEGAGRQMNIAVLAASPRPDGNSRALARALMDGAESAGHTTRLVDLNKPMAGFLRDCRTCRRPDGECSIQDGYRDLLMEHILPADALVYATPLYWYGMAAVLKNYFDRMVSYLSGSFPSSSQVMERMVDKRVALLISSEERYPGAALGLVAQVQEMSRYLHHALIGVVHGVGNKRGEVRSDPADPLKTAHRLGAQLSSLHHSDYRIDTERPNTVWPSASTHDDTAGIYTDV
jgi:multimeric flavodoxin WrbA